MDQYIVLAIFQELKIIQKNGKYTKEYIAWVRNVYNKYEEEYDFSEYSFKDNPSYIIPSDSTSLIKKIADIETNTSPAMLKAISKCGKEPQKYVMTYSLILRSGKTIEITKDEYSKILILLQDYIL